MALTRRTANSGSLFSSVSVILLLFLGWGCAGSVGFGTFGFGIHHVYSDPVKGILAVDNLPEKGTPHYYAAMAHRDGIYHGRRLATTNGQIEQGLTFADGNETYRISSLGYLHYANVSVGTPSLSFLVALDTGSDLFWLPCDCSKCVRGLETSTGDKIEFSIYSPSASSTSAKVPCNSSICASQRRCSSSSSDCPYQVLYLSNGTSSTGFLVDDVLHLTAADGVSKDVPAHITFGCGKVQTGSFLDGAAPNGLFGLGMDNTSVPSILAKEGYTSNSFSMCFGREGIGRITFGDKGSPDQGETPFNVRHTHPTYNISITQISIGGNSANLEFSAIFDSGTSFTYLNDPAYTQISESFNSEAQQKRHSSDLGLPFEYCYDLSPKQDNFSVPTVNLTMKGGDQFPVADPIVIVSMDGGYVYCLGVVKSGDVNIIGQNFMTGYRIVFDREKMVLGWHESNCYDDEKSTTLPVKPPTSATLPKNNTVPPGVAVKPEATEGNGNSSPVSGASHPMQKHTLWLNASFYAIMIVLLPFFAIH